MTLRELQAEIAKIEKEQPEKMDEVVKTCEEWGPNTVTELEYVNYSHIGCGKFWTFY